MVFLYFLAALGGIVLFALIVNRVTGTQAKYLDSVALEPDERELWRDEAADFATLPRLGQSAIRSYPRLRRHTVVWTTRRLLIAQKPLFSARRMLTHQVVLESASASADDTAAAAKLGGGFYGRGFETMICAATSLGVVNGKDCVRLQPSAESGAALNLVEAYVFSDRLAELRANVSGLG